MENQTQADIFFRANGRAAMLIFWVGVALYTKFKYFPS